MEEYSKSMDDIEKGTEELVEKLKHFDGSKLNDDYYTIDTNLQSYMIQVDSFKNLEGLKPRRKALLSKLNQLAEEFDAICEQAPETISEEERDAKVLQINEIKGELFELNNKLKSKSDGDLLELFKRVNAVEDMKHSVVKAEKVSLIREIQASMLKVANLQEAKDGQYRDVSQVPNYRNEVGEVSYNSESLEAKNRNYKAAYEKIKNSVHNLSRFETKLISISDKGKVGEIRKCYYPIMEDVDTKIEIFCNEYPHKKSDIVKYIHMANDFGKLVFILIIKAKFIKFKERGDKGDYEQIFMEHKECFQKLNCKGNKVLKDQRNQLIDKIDRECNHNKYSGPQNANQQSRSNIRHHQRRENCTIL